MATGRKFTANVVLAKQRGGEPTQFSIGDDVPEWALDRVGEHVIQGVTRASDAPEPVNTGDANTDAPEESDDIPADADDDSYESWTKEQLKEEAKAREIEGIAKMNKDALIAALEADDEE